MKTKYSMLDKTQKSKQESNQVYAREQVTKEEKLRKGM